MHTSVTITEIAKLCGVRPRTVRKWIESGQLRAVPVDRRWVKVRSYDLESILVAAWKARTPEGQDSPESARLTVPRPLIARFFLLEDGCWRWTMFALWPLLWLIAIVTSLGLSGSVH